MAAVISFASKTYTNSPVVDDSDLMQAGVIGLINGLRSYDPKKSKGSKKSTYILHCIKREMIEEANKFYGPFRLPNIKKLNLNKLTKLLEENKLSKKEIITTLGISNREYEELLKIAPHKESSKISSEIVEKQNTPYVEPIEELLEVYELSDMEKNIVALRLNGYTYKFISQKFGLSEETIRQRHIKILSKIRGKIEENGL